MKLMYHLIALFFIGTALSTAQTALTLDKAVQIALDRNTTVVQANNNIQSRQSAVQAAYGNLLPTVGVSGSWSQQNSSIGVTYVGGVPIGGSNISKQYSIGAGANVTLFDGFANTSNIKVAESRESASYQDFERAKQNAAFQTQQLFLNAVRQYQLLKVNEDNLKRSQQQLNRITESNKVGSVALADVYRQRVQVGADELSLIQAQNTYDKSKADLFAFLAIDNPDSYSIDIQDVPTDIDTNEFSTNNLRYSNFDKLFQQATAQRGDYLSSVQSVAAAEAGINTAKAGTLPSVTAGLNYGYDNSALGELFKNSSLSMRLSINYNIFNGFQTKSQIEEAMVNKRNTEEQLSQSQRQIAVELRKALLDLETAQKQINVTKTSVESAEMDRKIAEEKYNLGAGTLLDELIAQANYTNAVSNKVNAVIGYQLAKKQIEFVLGTIIK